jgi:hypothetical protein
MDPHEREFQQEVICPIFDTERANKLQEFECSVVQNNNSAPAEDLPTLTK